MAPTPGFVSAAGTVIYRINAVASANAPFPGIHRTAGRDPWDVYGDPPSAGWEGPFIRESYEVTSGRDRFFRLLEKESVLLLDPSTGRLREEWAKEVVCPLCRNAEAPELFLKDGLRFVRCARCALVYMNPRLSAEAVGRLYGVASAANDAWVDVLLSDAEETFQVADFGDLLDRIDAHGGGARLLDVGCSVGRLLRLARDRGYRGVGLEPGPRASEHARDAWGLDVRQDLLEEAGFSDGSFDVVTLVEVLEHAARPQALLGEIRRVLRPGGLLLAGVPNVMSLGVMALGREARTFNRNHLVYYEEATLRSLLEQCGFEVVETSTAVSLLDSVLNRMQGLDPFDTPGVAGLPGPLQDVLAQADTRERLDREICAAGLGYRLRILARKV